MNAKGSLSAAFFMGKVSAVQVGKILSKLADEDERIVRKSYGKYRTYSVPLKKAIYNSIPDSNLQ